MKLEMYFFEYVIDFIEVLISCYFVTRFYEKQISEKGKALLLFSVVGATGMLLREIGVIPLPDFAVPFLVPFLYSRRICHGRVQFAAFLSVLNYFLLGVVNLFVVSLLGSIFGMTYLAVIENENRVLLLVIIRLAQVVIFGVGLKFQKLFLRDTLEIRQMDMRILLVPFISIFILAFFYYVGYSWTSEAIYLINLFISFIVLIGNFAFFVFKTVLAQEREEKAALREHNRLSEMQLRNQHDMRELYDSMRMLRHDISSHLSIIFGYIELEEYHKARDYIAQLRKEMDSMEPVHTGNVTLDALLGSKGVLARDNGIRVDVEAAVPSELQIEETHLAVMIGNLYDNAIDASLKIEDIAKRYIRIEIVYKERNLMIHFSNAAKQDAKRIGDVWHTTKAQVSEHGFGIKSIDRVVSQYNGFCKRELKDNIFTCRIRIPDVRTGD